MGCIRGYIIPILTIKKFEFEPLAPEEAITQIIRDALDFENTNWIFLLDAALSQLQPEWIYANHEDARCLWQGQAAEEFAAVAPWMIPLCATSPMLQNLMTKGPSGWHWWKQWPGILIAPRRRIEDLRIHLRHLGRVQDAQGKSYLLRFWEARTAEAFWASFMDDADHIGWRYGADVAKLAWATPTGIQVVSLEHPVSRYAMPAGGIDAYRPMFQAQHWEIFVDRLHEALDAEGPPFASHDRAKIAAYCDASRATGYQSEAAIWDMVRAMILLDRMQTDYQSATKQAWKDQRPPDNASAARRLYLYARTLYTKEP